MRRLQPRIFTGSSIFCALWPERHPCKCAASIDVVADRELKRLSERWWRTSSTPALDLFKLYKLIGSEFAGPSYASTSVFPPATRLSCATRATATRRANAFHVAVDSLLRRFPCRNWDGDRDLRCFTCSPPRPAFRLPSVRRAHFRNPWPPGNCDRRRQSGHRQRRRAHAALP